MSDTIDLNLGNVKTREPLPDNTYDVRVAEVETKTSKSGNPMVSLTLEITSGEHEGRKLWENLVIHENTMWKVKQVLEALTGDNWDQDGMQLDPTSLVGYTARAVVVQEPHWDEAKANAGAVVNRIDSYINENAGGGISLT